MARPAFTMTEQAAWHATPDGTVGALEMPDGGRWLVTVRPDGPEVRPLRPAGSELVLDVILPFDVPALGGALAELGPVSRFRNPNLWDALGTAIIRQVIRAA
ncbi:hypothetical protein DPM19_34480 [Actinomadura craniellae]|uniref:Uncharacterized protein n=1 Tax=Actinomadura craniellae TaxID=2231787 RepID=A0A365GV46_9ACTN|nr:hypothetical protein [Actinomadura craniellae]RAY10664.1 hypothetical protein DPM19_34480 [Actinomadura craniellae]